MIGERVIRIDGEVKVRGRAKFGDDLHFPEMLHACCRFADITCGKITRIGIDKAMKIPGVVRIALYADVPGKPLIGAIRQDQYPLVKDRVYYQGDVIAIVAATSLDAAREAAEAIEVEFEPENGIYDVEEAYKPDARLIHPEFESNVVVHYPLRKGDVEQGFRQSDRVMERTYRTGYHEHAYIEPETVAAEPEISTGGFKVYGSIQNPFTTRGVVAGYLGIPLNRVNVHGSVLGGSFGGKDDTVNAMACRVALLSQLTDRPVKLTYRREESFRESYKRHPYILRYKVGYNADGRLNAMKIDMLADAGAYSSQTFFVNWRSVVQATGPYVIPNVHTDIRGIYTNNVYTGAFRGFGSPQIVFAQETLMDEIAADCGLTPIEIREINGFRNGSRTASGQLLDGHEVSLIEVMNRAVEKCDFIQKRAQYQSMESERYRYGIGLAVSHRGCSLGAEGTDAAAAVVSMQADGSVYIITGLNENGQGLKTSFCMIAAQELGIALGDIVFLDPQTSTVTDGGPTVASRGTIMGGKAVELAAKEVRRRLFETVKEHFDAEHPDDLEWKDGMIRKEGFEPMAIKEVAHKAAFSGVNLSAYGWYRMSDAEWHHHTGQGRAYNTFVYGCQVAEVRVEKSTGKLEVLKITAVHDAGKIINRTGAEGQVYGGVAQGMGYGMLEDYNVQEGVLKSENLDEYLIPTAMDVPDIDAEFIENPDDFGPYGAKSLGEPTLELTAAAVNNAYFHAVGKPSDSIPINLEKALIGKPLYKPHRSSETGEQKKLRLGELTVERPTTIEEALRLDGRYLAGGTDLLVQLRNSAKSERLIDISRIEELTTMKGGRIGSGVTFTKLLQNNELMDRYPVLREAISRVGALQIRNRATIGGNIVNAAPCADSVPPLILYGAKLRIAGSDGMREINAADFVLGAYKTALNPGEILESIILPEPEADNVWSYYQLGRRNAMNITRMSCGITAKLNPDSTIATCRIVQGSLLARPGRLFDVEEAMIGQNPNQGLPDEAETILKALLDKEISGRWSSEYKIPAFIGMVNDLVRELAGKGEQK